MFFCRENGIYIKKRMNYLWKELFRKVIHCCTAFVPLFLHFAKIPVITLLSVTGIFYVVAETARHRGKEVPLVSTITLWEENPAAIGIFSLAFGDGLASLAGKFFGKVKIPFSGGKTAAGSLMCFFAIFISTFCVSRNVLMSLVLALEGALIEILPLKDFDNLLIPVIIGGTATALHGLV